MFKCGEPPPPGCRTPPRPEAPPLIRPSSFNGSYILQKGTPTFGFFATISKETISMPISIVTVGTCLKTFILPLPQRSVNVLTLSQPLHQRSSARPERLAACGSSSPRDMIITACSDPAESAAHVAVNSASWPRSTSESFTPEFSSSRRLVSLSKLHSTLFPGVTCWHLRETFVPFGPKTSHSRRFLSASALASCSSSGLSSVPH